MKAILAVAIVGILGFLGTVTDPALEMWAPLIVACVPLLIFMMWPVHDSAAPPITKSGETRAA